jgi:hypothetical protein
MKQFIGIEKRYINELAKMNPKAIKICTKAKFAKIISNDKLPLNSNSYR